VPHAKFRPTLVLSALIAGWCGLAVQGVLVSPVLPLFQEKYGVGPGAASLVLTSALLVATISIPVMSRLGDRYGKKRLMVVAMAFLAGGGIIAAVAPTFGVLLIGRSMQGTAAVMLPLGISLIRDEFPEHLVRRSSSILGASIGIAGGIGLVVAGLLVGDEGNLDAVLRFSAAYGVFALLCVSFLVPESDFRVKSALDVPGAVLLSLGLVCLLLTLSEGGTWGWGSALTLGVLAAGVLLLAAWVLVERRHADPLIDVRLLVRPAVLSTGVASFAFGFAQLAGFVAIANMVQVDPAESGYGFGATVLQSGWFVLPQTTVQFLAAFVAARLVRRWPSPAVITAGYGAAAVGLLLLALESSQAWQVVGFSCVYGAGLGVSFALLPPRLVDTVSHEQMTPASAISAVLFNVGQAGGGAVLGAVLAATTAAGALAPSESGYSYVFLACAVVSVVGGVVFALLAGRATRHARGAAPSLA